MTPPRRRPPDRPDQTLRLRPGLFGTLPGMLAAEIWYWWIGIVLTGVGVLSVLGLIVGYLKNVTAPRYPNRRQRSDD